MTAPLRRFDSLYESETEIEVENNFRDWPTIEPGEYLAYSRHANVYFDKIFKRWVCVVLFDVLDNGGELIRSHVPWWLNLGSGEKPKARRRSNYCREWLRVNEDAPRRGDRMSAKVFTGRLARLEIANTTGTVPTSKVARILCWEGPKRNPKQKRAGINQSINQLIN